MTSQEKWLNLKLDLLPCIAQEVEKIIQDYQDLSEDIKINRFKSGNQSLQKLTLLQAKVQFQTIFKIYENNIKQNHKIRARIEEFDRFYDKNYADYRIGYFEKMKLRLRKLLSPHVEVNRIIYEEAMKLQNAAIQQSNNNVRSISPIEIRSDKSFINRQNDVKNSSQIQNEIKQQNNLSSVKTQNKSLIITQQQQQNQQNHAQQQKPQTQIQKQQTGIKSQQPKQVVPPQQKTYNFIQLSKEQNRADLQKTQDIQKEQKEELVFTIKMSKEEYLQYLTARQKTK